jgi:rSAM/selenodomain-associated transferase 2
MVQVASLSTTRGVAVVVPVLDDAVELARLLERIAAWPVRPAEIAVVAASDAAALAALCARHGCRLIHAEPNRGLQLDLGARATHAPVLWFLHADAAPPPEALAAIEGAVAAGAEGGCFRFGLAGARTPTKRLLERLVALRVRLGGIAYGDQGLFAQRSAYVETGGFPHQPLFEEVRLVRALRRRGAFRVLDCALPVSTRRWERDGWWRRSCRNRWLALRYACGAPAERLAATYHMGRPQGSGTSI